MLTLLSLWPNTAVQEMKTYEELSKLNTFDDRFNYLKLNGRSVFTHRYVNQALYQSYEWRQFRQRVIIRDNGCDLGVKGHDISSNIHIHHINPITEEDVINRAPCVFDMNNVICVSSRTHNAIHYGDKNLLAQDYVERKPGDTCPWRSKKCGHTMKPCIRRCSIMASAGNVGASADFRTRMAH